MSLRKQGLDEQRKLSSEAAEHTSGRDTVKVVSERIDAMVLQAGARGIDVVRDRRDRVVGFGSRTSNRLDLARRFPGGAEDYRLFSAVVHGHSWALLQVGLDVNQPKGTAVKQAKPQVLRYPCLRVIE